jgi:mRNA-degrading endonuclease toxin of MazEF toxin-antitoxin module
VRSGEIAIIDFGIPVGSTPALIRPAVVVTAQPTLDQFDQTFHVVPITSTPRQWPSDVPTAHGHAQCHLLTVVDRSQVVEQTTEHVGAVLLAQIREVTSVLLGL